MNKFNLKEHNQKISELTKKAANGTYPSKKVATIGSNIGLVIGILLFVIGGFGVIMKNTWGVSCAFAGSVTIASNAINLKRIKRA